MPFSIILNDEIARLFVEGDPGVLAVLHGAFRHAPPAIEIHVLSPDVAQAQVSEGLDPSGIFWAEAQIQYRPGVALSCLPGDTALVHMATGRSYPMHVTSSQTTYGDPPGQVSVIQLRTPPDLTFSVVPRNIPEPPVGQRPVAPLPAVPVIRVPRKTAWAHLGGRSV